MRLPRSARRKELKESHHFDCGCQTCLIPSHLRSQSDRNRRRLSAILSKWESKGLDDCLAHSAKDATLEDIDLALKLSKTEGLFGELPGIWMQQFYIQAAYDEYDKAKRAARKALETFSRLRGRDGAKRHWISEYAENPKKWASYGICAAATK